MRAIRRLIQFLREVRSEMRKVIWPTRQETGVFTLVVLFSVTVVAVIFWVLDTVFAELFKLVVG